MDKLTGIQGVIFPEFSDEADAYFDKANIDKAQLIDKLAATLDEYTKIELMLK